MLNQKVNTLLSRLNLWKNPTDVQPEMKIEGPAFIGTKKEFKRYVGPVFRNLVQQMTRKHRLEIGHCQHCEEKENLEAAHVAGRNRNHIIDDLLKNYSSGDLFQVNLKEFEKRFKAEHEPLEKSILILCKSCHYKYDSKPLEQKAAEVLTFEKPMTELPKEMLTGSKKQPLMQPLFTSSEFADFRRYKIGKLVRETLPALLTKGRIGDSELLKLQDENYSKMIFDVNYAVLKKVNERLPLTDNREINGYPRYYAHPHKYNGGKYLITSEWYDRNFEYYLKWLKKFAVE